MKRIAYTLFLGLIFACSSDDGPLPVILSINAGGPAFEFQGKQWEADQYIVDGKTYLNEINIESTQNDTLFHSESYNSPDFTYEIPLTGNGPFTVDLHFAEIFHGIMNSEGEGARIFNVDIENGQSQQALVRNNIVMNCNNGGSSAGIMVGSDRESSLYHNTVYNAEPRSGGFYVGHADHDTAWRYSILENGINTDYAVRPLDEANNILPSLTEMNAMFTSPLDGDFSLAQGADIVEQGPTDGAAPHDFCGYPRGATADLGAIEYSTTYQGTPCATLVKEMYDRIP